MTDSAGRRAGILLSLALLAGCTTAKIDTRSYAADLELALTKHMDFTQPEDVAPGILAPLWIENEI